MRRILIAGGTGFFGKSILDYRVRHPGFLANAELTILSRHPSNFVAAHPQLANQPGVSFVAGDVRTFSSANFTHGIAPGQSCHSCNSRTDFDTVIHAATAAITTISDEDMHSTIVDGTRHVLEFAKSCGARRILFTSSGAVYGPQTDIAAETTPCQPTTAYAKGKLSAEKMCVDSGIPTLIARCFAFTGPYLNRNIHFAIGNFIQNCLDGQPIVVKGDGTPRRSYLYADDLVEWLFAILKRGEPGRPYNVGSPHALSIRELAEAVRTALGTRNEIQILGTPHASSLESPAHGSTAQTPDHPNNRTIEQPDNPLPTVYVPDTTRAEKELGLKVTVSLVDAIRKSAV